MHIKKYRSILEILVASVVAFVFHKLYFVLFNLQDFEDNFQHPLIVLYSFFLIFSIVIVLILLRVKFKNIDSVGNTFLLLTFIKMGIAYVLLLPILNSSFRFIKVEKLNFFIIFAIFLTIETIVTIRILNNKQ